VIVSSTGVSLTRRRVCAISQFDDEADRDPSDAGDQENAHGGCHREGSRQRREQRDAIEGDGGRIVEQALALEQTENAAGHCISRGNLRHGNLVRGRAG
jgi:hypothetical protein